MPKVQTKALPKTCRIERDQLLISTEGSFSDLKDPGDPIDPMLRAYRSAPDGITIQIRAYCGIGAFGNGKKRNMIGSVVLSRKEAESLVQFLSRIIDELSSI